MSKTTRLTESEVNAALAEQFDAVYDHVQPAVDTPDMPTPDAERLGDDAHEQGPAATDADADTASEAPPDPSESEPSGATNASPITQEEEGAPSPSRKRFKPNSMVPSRDPGIRRKVYDMCEASPHLDTPQLMRTLVRLAQAYRRFDAVSKKLSTEGPFKADGEIKKAVEMEMRLQAGITDLEASLPQPPSANGRRQNILYIEICPHHGSSCDEVKAQREEVLQSVGAEEEIINVFE